MDRHRLRAFAVFPELRGTVGEERAAGTARTSAGAQS
jgi:hypothetical protein